MHESARRGLVRLLGGAGVLALLVVLVVAVTRGCRSPEERISALVDDARDALNERRRDEFLAHFAEDLVYRGKAGGRAALERDVAQWMEMRVWRVGIAERTIAVEGASARIDLRCEVGAILRAETETVTVELAAREGEDGWRIVAFDWRRGR